MGHRVLIVSAPRHPVPVQLIDAGPGTASSTGGDRNVLQDLGERMEAVRVAASAEEVLRGLVDLVGALVWADAITIEMRGSAAIESPWVMVYRGLDAAEAEAVPQDTEPARFAHRLSLPVTGEGARDGRLSLWRTEAPFDLEDRGRADLASTTVAVLVHEFLRRLTSVQRRQWFEAAEDICDALVATGSAPPVVQLALDRMRDVAGADLAWLVGGTHDHPVLQVLSGDGVDRATARSIDLRHSLSAGVLASGDAVHVNDLAQVTRLVIPDEWQRWRRAGAALVEPVRTDGRVVAALGMLWFAERSASYLCLDPTLPPRFAMFASLAIGVGRSRADAERLAVLEERDRIRLDLHDRAIQRLYALGMGLESARLRDDPASVGELLDHAVDRVDETIAEIRRTIAGLGTADGGMELYDAMAAMVDEVGATASFRPELRVLGLSRVSVAPDVCDDLLSVLHEALSNVVRHAGSSRCRVTLHVDGQVRLTVDDDGRGVPADVVGSGLTNLRRRAAAHGGELTLTSLDPGTRLVWAVPHREPSTV